MELIGQYSKEDLATLYIASHGDGRIIEFVESVQPPFPRDEKWVLIVSTSFGCPVKCKMCDAGGHFRGFLTADQILSQIDHMVLQRYPAREIPVPKFKIQFARMGEPALNPEVLTVIERLGSVYNAPGLMPCVSTVAPKRCGEFLEELRNLKNSHYRSGRFQLQFSIHTTDSELRNTLIPVRKWDLDDISRFGERFVEPGDRRIALNFAAIDGWPVDHHVLEDAFDPELFLIKLTPLNPTDSVQTHQLQSFLDAAGPAKVDELVCSLKEKGFEVIVSIGEREENQIGTNCGQYATRFSMGLPEVSSTYQSTKYQVNPVTSS